MDQDGDTPPTLWFQPPIATTYRRRPLIDPVVLIFLLSNLILLSLFFIIPPLLSHILTISKPVFLKYIWYYLIIFLDLFLILGCGFHLLAAIINGGLRRSSSSYPDLRHQSLRENGENRLRFSDDFGVNAQYSSPVKENFYQSEQVSGNEVGPNVPERITQLHPPSHPAPATVAPPSVKLRRRRTSRSGGRDETVDPTGRFDDVIHNKLGPQVSEPTTEIATKIASLDDQQKRKRKNKQSIPPVIPSTSTEKPGIPTKTSNNYDRDGFLPSCSQSPWIPIPPPLPPFKMPAMKFELRGDFVRLRSMNSSVSSSPDREDSFGPSPISFLRPDINAKADSFISRLKDEWKMEKIKI